MKMPMILKRKKLSASTARRSRGLGLPDALDYEQMSEPNMKLSRALLIVLVLHIVAVAGIIAFNTIKTREVAKATTTTAAASFASKQPEAAPAVPETAAQPAPAVTNKVKPVASRTETKTPLKPAGHAKPAANPAGVPDSGQIYTVVKGDNPVTIARHLHVSYDALLELNQIEDPRKLQIGQKLRVPAPSTAKHQSD